MSDHYAVVKDDTITNVVIWDGLSEYVPGEGSTLTALPVGAWIGWQLVDGGWRAPQPFPSWSWDGVEWQPPTPQPEGLGPWRWDEDTLSWVEVTA